MSRFLGAALIRRAATNRSYSEAKTPAKTRPGPHRDIPADDLVGMRIHGVSIDYVKKMKARFNDVSVDDLVEMKIYGRSRGQRVSPLSSTRPNSPERPSGRQRPSSAGRASVTTAPAPARRNALSTRRRDAGSESQYRLT